MAVKISFSFSDEVCHNYVNSDNPNIYLQHNSFAVLDHKVISLVSVSMMSLTREGTQIRKFGLAYGECPPFMFIKVVPCS